MQEEEAGEEEQNGEFINYADNFTNDYDRDTFYEQQEAEHEFNGVEEDIQDYSDGEDGDDDVDSNSY